MAYMLSKDEYTQHLQFVMQEQDTEDYHYKASYVYWISSLYKYYLNNH